MDHARGHNEFAAGADGGSELAAGASVGAGHFAFAFPSFVVIARHCHESGGRGRLRFHDAGIEPSDVHVAFWPYGEGAESLRLREATMDRRGKIFWRVRIQAQRLRKRLAAIGRTHVVHHRHRLAAGVGDFVRWVSDMYRAARADTDGGLANGEAPNFTVRRVDALRCREGFTAIVAAGVIHVGPRLMRVTARCMRSHLVRCAEGAAVQPDQVNGTILAHR